MTALQAREAQEPARANPQRAGAFIPQWLDFNLYTQGGLPRWHQW